MKNTVFLSMFLLLTNICFCSQLKLIKTIPIDEGALFVPMSFVVLEEGSLLFTDIRDKDHQFKIFNEKGQLIKAWGKMGPGPDEFGGLGFLDYLSPYLAVADAGKHRVHIFEKLQNYELKKIGEILSWEMDNQIKIYEKSVLICGNVVSPKGRKYVLFERNFNEQKTNYVLPLEYSYGTASIREYEKVAEEVSGLSGLAFLDVYQDTAFYVSNVRLRVARINLKSRKIDFFGKQTKNFRPLTIDKKTRYEMMQIGTGKKIIEELLSNYSFVSGIFADNNLIGVIYVNREKKIGNDFYFIPYVQFYDYSGNLQYEQKLPEVIGEDRVTRIFYQKNLRHLYFLSIVSGESSYRCTIYKYAIEP